MPPDRIPCVGGPLDGHAIPKQPGRVAWVAGALALEDLRPEGCSVRLGVVTVRRGGGACPRPTSGRALYELGRGVSGLVYIYAGHRKVFCNMCGTYHGKAEGGREKRPCALGGDGA